MQYQILKNRYNPVVWYAQMSWGLLLTVWLVCPGAAKQDLQPLAATTPTLYAITMTLANTEYSQALPANTKILEFRCRATGYDVRFAYVTGKVATSVDPYRTLSAGQTKTIDNLNLAATVLYVACGTAGQEIEVEAWS